MPYFDKTKKMSNILMGGSAILFVMAGIVFFGGSVGDQIFEFSNGNYVRGGIVFSICFLLSAFMFIAGIAMKCVAKDAKEELDTIRRELDKRINTEH